MHIYISFLNLINLEILEKEHIIKNGGTLFDGREDIKDFVV
jgi:hypothetical protein